MIALTLIAALHGAALQPLVKCQPEVVAMGGCGDLSRPVWKAFEAENGELIRLNVASIRGSSSGISAEVYVGPRGYPYDPTRLGTYIMDCRGQVADIRTPYDTIDAPPRSLIGAVMRYACNRVRAPH